MAFSKLTGKGIDLTTNIITEFNSTGIDDNATSTAITIAANNSVAIPNIHGNTTTIGNLTVGGDFTVTGTNFAVDSTSLSVEDSLIHLASNNDTSDIIDIGLIGHYSNDGNTALYTGFFRDASDEEYYLFNGLSDDHDTATTIDKSGTGFTLASLNVGAITSDGAGYFNYTKVDNGAVYNSFSGASGVSFSPTGTTPCDDSGSLSDDTHDLGRLANRWQDLFLSNTISLTNATTSSFLQVSTNILQFGTSSTDALAIYTDNTERMRIDSAGSIGIGTDSPARILHIEKDGLADLLLRDTSTYSAGTGPAVIFQGNDSGSTITQFGAIYGVSNGSNSGELTFETRNSGSTAERMRIDSSGRVGIGRNPTDVALEVAGPSYTGFDGPATVFLYGDANYNSGDAGSGILFGGEYTSAGTVTTLALISGIKENTNNTDYAGALTFQTRPNGSIPVERMRIDSSGNVGIGTTPASWGSSSTALNVGDASGFWNFSLGANRQTNIVHNLYYDGQFKTRVTDGYGSMHIVSSGQDGAASFTFYSGNGTADTAITLNKIATLSSNGLNFGTDTAAANALDDYEEGTFTPSFTTSGTLTVNSATYTKIGRQVTCCFYLSAATTCSGDITGLPFTPNGESAGVVGYQTHVSGETIGILVQAANVWNLRIGQTQYGLAAGKQIRGMFTYFTNA